nr:uncharacterized protein LOC113819345 [Penaeus vannamei]
MRVHHNMSTPHYPQSNGHAEAHVKVMKHLITKTAPTGDLYNNEDFTNGLLELRSTSRPGLSPAMISLVPTHSSAFDTKWHVIAKTLDERHSAKDHAAIHYNAHAKSLSPIPLGTDARIQNHSTKRWDATGIIVGVGRKRDYLIKTPSGRIFWRNRRFLLPVPPPLPSAQPPHNPPAVKKRVRFNLPPRRSPRLNK